MEQVLPSLHQVVEDVPRFTLVELSGAQAQLTARMNMKSWGEQITFHFHPLEPARTQIQAQCEPRLGTTMVDYGQGAKDLRTLLGAIEQHTAQEKHVAWALAPEGLSEQTHFEDTHHAASPVPVHLQRSVALMRAAALLYAGLLVVGALSVGVALAMFVLMEISRVQDPTGVPMVPGAIFKLGCGLTLLGSVFVAVDTVHFHCTGRRL